MLIVTATSIPIDSSRFSYPPTPFRFFPFLLIFLLFSSFLFLSLFSFVLHLSFLTPDLSPLACFIPSPPPSPPRAHNGSTFTISRWLNGVAAAPGEDLCAQAAFCAESEEEVGGNTDCRRPEVGREGEPATAATVSMSQLATAALAIEPSVRG